ncbi:MAG: hypothetical protein EOO04_10025 [Chitinophagaceae bacterium]|nr:MAG: hypothetical protein EOO04_10025 [Chitinophagaceae bacterium]
MKLLISITATIILASGNLRAQSQKEPIYLDNGPTVFEYNYDPYYSYADQGQAMYQNNSQFYNKDNVLRSPSPVGNGQYVTPGNSNPLNQNLYRNEETSTVILYNGHVPVREIRREGNYSDEVNIR